MAKLYSILYISGGISQWALVLFIIAIVINLMGSKDRLLLTFSMIIVVVFTSFHWWNKYKLNSELTKMTCGEITVPDKLSCRAIQSSPWIGFTSARYVDISTSEKDQPIRLEKFFRENEYQINRQVRFKIEEKCDFLFFCKYDYVRMSTEFEGRKDRIETFLTDDVKKQIYFE